MFLLPEKTVRLHVGFRGVGGTLLDRWYHRFHVSHTETVGKNVCYILNIRSSKNTGLQTQDMISDKKLSLFHPVLSKLSVFVFRYRLRNSSSPSISRYINKIYFRVHCCQEGPFEGPSGEVSIHGVSRFYGCSGLILQWLNGLKSSR